MLVRLCQIWVLKNVHPILGCPKSVKSNFYELKLYKAPKLDVNSIFKIENLRLDCENANFNRLGEVQENLRFKLLKTKILIHVLQENLRFKLLKTKILIHVLQENLRFQLLKTKILIPKNICYKFVGLEMSNQQIKNYASRVLDADSKYITFNFIRNF